MVPEDCLRRYQQDPTDPGFSERLAESLKWERPARKPLSIGAFGGIATELSIGGEPAALILGCGSRSTVDLVDTVASYAYQSNIPWGMLVAKNEARILNSQWSDRKRWYSVSLEPAHHYDVAVLQTLTPPSVAQGELDAAMRRIRPPEEHLVPVDDLLVDRLDNWRKEALRFAPRAGGIDESIHTLFAQLFVLRAVEDRQLAKEIPALESLIGRDLEALTSGLEEIFSKAAVAIQTELFEDHSFGNNILDSPVCQVAGCESHS